MTIKHLSEYRDRELSQKTVEAINTISKKPVRFMEVCGTHTVAIFRSGIRSILPDTITLISGPGCPVCVTAQSEIDAFIDLSGYDKLILATFGDLLRVPGTESSLQNERAKGRDIRIVYSTVDALEIAKSNPEKKVVFLGVGFETTAPTIAASILTARKHGVKNYFVFSAHKTVPPALCALMEMKGVNIDGYLLPGHVSVIIGTNSYRSFFEKYRIPCVVTGFEPVDILQSIFILAEQIESGAATLVNNYSRVVQPEGNQKAQQIMYEVFNPADAVWRGIGMIPQSGLKIKKEFERFDAQKVFGISLKESKPPKGCLCGEVLTGRISPPECPLFNKTCTPMSPAGPCMVSSEGSCAAFYKYHPHE